MHFFCIFFQKNLHISKNCCTFAPDFKNKQFKGDANSIKTATRL